MPAAERSVYEAYLLGIVLRSRSVQRRCDSLLTRDFASEAPRRLARTLAGLAEYLSRVALTLFDQISWDDEGALVTDLRQLQSIDSLLREFAAHLRYVHGAQSERMPWSTISALERSFRQFAPKTRFLLRPKWNYNYTVTTTDLRRSYLESLEEFASYLPGEDLAGKVLEQLDEPLHLIAFPALERDNIVLHALFGHEFGHYFVDGVLTPDREIPFKVSVLADVEAATDQELVRENATLGTSGELFSGHIREERVGRNIHLAWSHYRRALEELLADAVSIFLFGPAALFSMLEIALQEDLDQLPLPQHGLYPPWRMRLRSALRILDHHGNRLSPASAAMFRGNDAQARAERVAATEDYIRRESEKTDDQRMIKISPIASIAYRQVDQDLSSSIERLLELNKGFSKAVKRFASRQLLAQVTGLIERLEHGITPNSLERHLDDRQEIDIVAILNAASLYRTSLDPGLGDGGTPEIQRAITLRSRADLLTLKAIELSDLAASYWKENPKKKRDGSAIEGEEDAQPKHQESRGVLSKSEIRAALQVGHVPDRLIVTPLLDPDETIGAGSIDVRLGNQFLIFKRESFARLDIAKADELNLERYQERQIKAFREPFILHPQQLVIGSTLEYIQLPKNLMCYVIGKSTWGRMGLIIATATKVDPGYRGCITLEIINEGEVPLVLYPGVPIAQLVLHRTQAGEGYQGGYSCATGPEFPNFLDKKATWDYWTTRRQK